MDLRGNIKPTDKFVTIKIAESIDSYNVRSHIGDHQIIVLIK
jgi:hypothetical protein